jgi:hypothetical protein
MPERTADAAEPLRSVRREKLIAIFSLDRLLVVACRNNPIRSLRLQVIFDLARARAVYRRANEPKAMWEVMLLEPCVSRSLGPREKPPELTQPESKSA